MGTVGCNNYQAYQHEHFSPVPPGHLPGDVPAPVHLLCCPCSCSHYPHCRSGSSFVGQTSCSERSCNWPGTCRWIKEKKVKKKNKQNLNEEHWHQRFKKCFSFLFKFLMSIN